MTRKRRASEPNDPVSEIGARKEFPLTGKSAEEARQEFARVITSSEMAAARTISAVEGSRGMGRLLDIPEVVTCLREQALAVSAGDTAHVECMLMNQATALQSLFARLIERGMGADMLPQYEAHMRIALRAQSQCRATLETLAAIKNPPVVYARQANIASGHQQVNNCTHAEETQIEPTQLSGGDHELRQDARASGHESRADSTVETMGKIDRAKVRRG